MTILPYPCNPDTAETQIMPYASDVEGDDNSDEEEDVSIASLPGPPVWSMVPCMPARSATGASCSAATNNQALAAPLASAGAEDAAASTDKASQYIAN